MLRHKSRVGDALVVSGKWLSRPTHDDAAHTVEIADSSSAFQRGMRGTIEWKFGMDFVDRHFEQRNGVKWTRFKGMFTVG